jgi:dihydrodipicolinate reductase
VLVLRLQSSSNNLMASIRLPDLAYVLAAHLEPVVVGKTGVAAGVTRLENRTQDYRALGVDNYSIGSHMLFEAAA